MRVSSAYKVQYEVRPSKQTERRIILDILRAGSGIGVRLDKYQYLGFGGVRFYDFEMIFRHLGIRDMTSLEIDETLVARCRYNKPFGFIDFHEKRLDSFLQRTSFKKPVIAWLDYDCVMNSDVVSDMRTVSATIPMGSFVFVTVDAKIPPGLATMSPEARLLAMKEEYGEFAIANKPSELTTEKFPFFAEQVLWSSLSESLSKRSDGTFLPLMRVFYKDTTLMMTVGACLCDPALEPLFRKQMNKQFRFLLPQNGTSPALIPAFNLTPRERLLLDTAVTRKPGEQNLGKTLRRLGFKSEEIAEYKRMFRFVPKYTEAYI